MDTEVFLRMSGQCLRETARSSTISGRVCLFLRWACDWEWLQQCSSSASRTECTLVCPPGGIQVSRFLVPSSLVKDTDELTQPAQYVHVRCKREWGKLLGTVPERRTELECQVAIEG